MNPETLLDASGLAGCLVVRDAEAADAVDDVRPRVVAEPESGEALAALLAWSSRERVSVVLAGNGTKLGWGRRPSYVDILVSARRLDRILAHSYGDLTATVQAGAAVHDVNRELARRGQWLPLDVSFDSATIGGTVATNDSGPLRHRYGTPRDLLIGINLATTDGRLVKAGGNVVKNVAGYDLGKLMSGSHGSLAAIVSVTFKLAPLPPASTTIVAAFRDPAALPPAVAAVSASQLEPAAFDVSIHRPFDRASGDRLLVRFASTKAAVDAQVERIGRLLDRAEIDVLSGGPEADAWRAHSRNVWSGSRAIIRASWLPARLAGVVDLLDAINASTSARIGLVGRAGVGTGLVHVDGDAAAQVDAIERLRTVPDIVGNTVVLRGSAAVKDRADVWAMPSDSATLFRALKRTFDPANILNAGRGPV